MTNLRKSLASSFSSHKNRTSQDQMYRPVSSKNKQEKSLTGLLKVQILFPNFRKHVRISKFAKEIQETLQLLCRQEE